MLLGVFLILWLPKVSVAGSRVEGCAQGCSVSPARREGPLRVLSLNVLHGFPRFEHLERRMDLIAAEIRQHDADIVLLQEVPWTLGLGSGAEYVADKAGMNHLYYRANGNRRAILFEEGEAILSRYPLQDPVSTELGPQAGCFEHRVALGAAVVTPWGELPVYTTHLTNGEAEVNRAQAKAMEEFVSASGSGPALVAGDLNALPGSPQVQSLSSQWIDAGESIRPDEALTCCVSDLTAGPSETLEKRIDYLFLIPGKGVAILNTQRVLDEPFSAKDGWQWASDHVGLLTVIGFEQ